MESTLSKVTEKNYPKTLKFLKKNKKTNRKLSLHSSLLGFFLNGNSCFSTISHLLTQISGELFAYQIFHTRFLAPDNQVEYPHRDWKCERDLEQADNPQRRKEYCRGTDDAPRMRSHLNGSC